MQAKVIITFERISAPAFLARAERIIGALTDNPHFPTPWPSNLATPAQLHDALSNFRSVFQATLSGDRGKIPARDAARLKLANLLKKLAPYLEVIADGDVDILASSGYELRRDVARGEDRHARSTPAASEFQASASLGELGY